MITGALYISVRQQEHCGEEGADDPGGGVDLLGFAGEEADKDVGDEAEADAVGDVVGEGHHGERQEGRDRDGGIRPVDIAHAGDHQGADIDERGRVCAGGHKGGDRAQEQRDEKQHACDDAGQTGAAADGDTGGGLDKGRDRAGAADGAHAGGKRVGEHGAVHVRDLLLALFILDEHISAAAGAVERAERIEHVDDAERERGGCEREDEPADAVTLHSEVAAEVKALGEDLAECHIAEIAEGVQRVQGDAGEEVLVKAGDGEAQRVIDDCAAEDAPEDRAADAALAQHRDGDERPDSHEDGHNGAPSRAAEQIQGHEPDAGRRIVHDDAGVLKAEEGDKQTDTGGDRRLDRRGDGVEDEAAQAGDGQQDENNAVRQHEKQRVGVAEAETEADRVDKKGVEAHAARLRKRQVGQQTDEQRADDGGERRGDIDRAVAHVAEAREHAGIDHEDIRHRHEDRHAGDDLGPHIRAVFGKLKSLFHLCFLLILFFSGNFPVHGGSVGFAGGLVDLRDLHAQRALTEGDLDHVSDLDLIACLYLPAVDADTLSVARLVGDGAALDEAGDF